MKVTVGSIGGLKRFLPDTKEIELEAPVTVEELKVLSGIPAKEHACYTVNGQVQKGEFKIADGDNVKFVLLVGAG